MVEIHWDTFDTAIRVPRTAQAPLKLTFREGIRHVRGVPELDGAAAAAVASAGGAEEAIQGRLVGNAPTSGTSLAAVR